MQEINKERRSNGLQDLKMDATLTEAAMNIALQEQGGNATVSNPEIYNDKYTIKGAFKLGDIDGYDEYEDNLWKETTKGKRAITKHVSELGKFLYKDSNISSTIGIGIVATDNPKSIPRELNNGSRYNVTYCFVSNWIAYDSTSYDIYKNNGKTVRTQMDLYIDSSNTYLIVDADKNELTPKYAYDVIKKGEKRKAHPGVWENIPVTGAKRFLCKLSNDGASWSSSNPSIVSVDANGNITAKKNGIATVAVKVGSLQATKKYVVSDIISVDTDTLLSLPNWKSKSDIPKEYTGNCYAGGYALEVKNGRITWSKNMKTNKITRPGSKKSTVKTKKLKGATKLVQWMSGIESGKRLWDESKSFPSTYEAFKSSPIFEEDENYKALYHQLSKYGHPRSKTPVYPQVSASVQEVLENSVLTDKDAKTELDKSVERINAKLKRYVMK